MLRQWCPSPFPVVYPASILSPLLPVWLHRCQSAFQGRPSVEGDVKSHRVQYITTLKADMDVWVSYPEVVAVLVSWYVVVAEAFHCSLQVGTFP